MPLPDPTEAQMNALHDYRAKQRLAHLKAQNPTSDTERTTPCEWLAIVFLASASIGALGWLLVWLSGGLK